MFTANCIGMKALPPQKDSPKAREASENVSNFELNNAPNMLTMNMKILLNF